MPSINTRPSVQSHFLPFNKHVCKRSISQISGRSWESCPSPTSGSSIRFQRVKAIDFCKEFNARTAIYNQGVPIPVIIQVKPDRTFTFEMKSPPTSWLLMKAAGVEKGSGKALKEPVGEVSLKHIWDIAKIKN